MGPSPLWQLYVNVQIKEVCHVFSSFLSSHFSSSSTGGCTCWPWCWALEGPFSLGCKCPSSPPRQWYNLHPFGCKIMFSLVPINTIMFGPNDQREPIARQCHLLLPCTVLPVDLLAHTACAEFCKPHVDVEVRSPCDQFYTAAHLVPYPGGAEPGGLGRGHSQRQSPRHLRTVRHTNAARLNKCGCNVPQGC